MPLAQLWMVFARYAARPKTKLGASAQFPVGLQRLDVSRAGCDAYRGVRHFGQDAGDLARARKAKGEETIASEMLLAHRRHFTFPGGHSRAVRP